MSQVIYKNIISTAILMLIAFFCFSQSPLVTEKFDKLFMGENFDSSNAYWSTVSNADNLLIVQEGEYIMHRKASVSPYAVMANFTNELSVFKLVTSVKLDKTSAPDGSIGLIFMAQPEGKGGFIFEINKNSYRLRQLNNGTYKYITGNLKNGGWMESANVKGLNQPNLVEIRTAEKNYDVILNNKFLLSFTEAAYTTGNFGFVIGPSSKGKADFLYLFTSSKEKNNSEGETNTNQKKENPPETDVLAFAESIITLKTQINKLTEDNEDLKQMIQALRGAEKESEKEKDNYEKEIKDLQLQKKKSSTVIDSLIKLNSDLMRYKEMVMGNDNGDLVINLSRNLKKERATSEELLKTNKLLTDSLVQIKTELKTMKSKNAELKTDKEQTVNTQKNKNNKDTIPEKKPEKKEFVLPKEN